MDTRSECGFAHRVVQPHTSIGLCATFLFALFNRDCHEILLDIRIDTIELFLYLNGFPNGRDHPAICLDILQFQALFFTILQPPVTDLIAAIRERCGFFVTSS